MEKAATANAGLYSVFSSGRLLRLLLAILQVWTLFYLVGYLSIEKESGLYELRYIVLGAFVITAFTPLAWRPLVFTGTSVLTIYFAFGPVSGSILLASGLLLIGLCHLPVNYTWRILLIAIVFTAMAILRFDLFYAPRAALIVPYLASMFMFRIIGYLYDHKNNAVNASPLQRVNYFFLFPNIAFLLFPIVDFKTSQKTYYTLPDTEMWQKGVRWMLRGVSHLLAYKAVTSLWGLPGAGVHDLPSLLYYCFSNYFMILRLSGIFHLAVGLLCLFGYNLHPVFNNYFLATSFTNLWRRINVYWREFMMKVFFYPLIFKIKKRTEKYALPLTMICMFFLTWVLHNYQYVWLRGYAKLAAPDILFWMILGICITINAVIEERRLMKVQKIRSQFATHALLTLKMMGMLLFMGIMWSLWSSASLEEWRFLVSKAWIFSAHQAFYIGVACVLFFVIVTGVRYAMDRDAVKKLFEIRPQHTLVLTATTLWVAFVIVQLHCRRLLPARAANLLDIVITEKTNENQKRTAEANYYKRIIDGDADEAHGPWETSLNPRKRNKASDELVIRSHEFLSRKLKPSMNVMVDGIYRIETNSEGLRDKEYTLRKPPGTYRIALLGSSYEMGAGVNNPQVFEAIAEDSLNANRKDERIEILNFAVYRYHVMQQVDLCNTRVFGFQPDAVMYFAHSREEQRVVDVLTELIRNTSNLKYPFLKHIAHLSGVKQSMSANEISERLQPFAGCVLTWGYMQIAASCKNHGSAAVWVYLPTTNDKADQEEIKRLEELATKIGFTTIDLAGVYEGMENKLVTSSDDPHPNALGHRMIAQRLYHELKNRLPFKKVSQ